MSDRPAPLALKETLGEIREGARTYLIGHPNSVRETVMTDGNVVSLGIKHRFNPDWTHVTIRHDVTSFPGSSGGPLLTDDGAVAAIHTNGKGQLGCARATSSIHVRKMLDSLSKPGFKGIRDFATNGAEEVAHYSFNSRFI